jgi:hypothetical protein
MNWGEWYLEIPSYFFKAQWVAIFWNVQISQTCDPLLENIIYKISRVLQETVMLKYLDPQC